MSSRTVLPNGYLAALVERTGKSRSELKYRAQFAATVEESELANALANYPAWRELCSDLKHWARCLVCPGWALPGAGPWWERKV